MSPTNKTIMGKVVTVNPLCKPTEPSQKKGRKRKKKKSSRKKKKKKHLKKKKHSKKKSKRKKKKKSRKSSNDYTAQIEEFGRLFDHPVFANGGSTAH